MWTRVLRALAACALAVAAFILTLVLADGAASIFDDGTYRGHFCAWCRQVELARSAPLAGMGGVAPKAPPARFAVGPWPRETLHKLDLSQRFPPGYFQHDLPYLSPRPGLNQRAVLKTREGKVIYDVGYGIDPYRRRVVPGQEGSRTRFLMIFGCSYTFGEGVEDDQSLPAFVSRSAPFHKVYNYGMNGYAPSDMLLRLRNTQVVAEISEGSGAAAYLFIDDHLSRVIGTMSIVGSWGRDKPYFEEGPGGELRWMGSFETARPRTTSLFKTLLASRLVHRLDLEIPPFVSEANLRFFAKMVAVFRDELAAQKKIEDFRFVFMPGSRLPRLLIPYLEEVGIRYVNYGEWELRSLTDRRIYFEHDNHPNTEYYKLFAPYLARDLGVAR